MSTPHASTPILTPPAANAPRCAAASIPKATPDTTSKSASLASVPSSAATRSPYVVDARDPTIEIDSSSLTVQSIFPRTHKPTGVCVSRSSSCTGQLLSPGTMKSIPELSA